MKKQNSTNRLCSRFMVTVALALTTAVTARADFYTNTIKLDGPLAYYPLNIDVDPGTDLVATDLSGNGLDGTYNGTAPYANTVPGPSVFLTNALSFSGFNTWVDLGSPSLLSFYGPITMEAWVQPASPTVGSGPPADIIAKGYDLDSGNNNELVLRCNGGYYFGGTYNNTNGGAAAQGGTQTTNWTYVVSTYDGAKWSLYLNGKLINQTPDTIGSIDFPAPWSIGDGTVNGANRNFIGNITQVAIYGTALSSNKVMNHYFVGEIGVPATSVVGLITDQPQPQSSFSGGSATFSVDYLSAYPTTNQWYKNNSPLTGKTNKSLTLNNVQSGDVANYSVRIGNSQGTTNSAAASLTLLAAGNSLRWSAVANSGVWDAGTSANWINLANSQQVVFNTGDLALFDDTAGVPTTATLSGAVSPNTTTINSSVNSFTIDASGGSISGPGSLIKKGGSTLEISGANDFSGSVTISGGTVKMDEPLSGAATSLGAGSGASIVVTNGATLAMNASGGYPAGNSGLSTRAITISGSGVGGLGALQSVGNDIYHDGSPNGGLFRSLTLAGDATIGSGGRWDLGQEGILTFISTGGSNYNLTCLQGGYSEWHSVTIDTNLGNIDYTLASGNYWVVLGMGNSLGNPTNTITLHGNVTMQLQGNGNGQDNGYGKIIHVTSGSSFGFRPYNGAGDYHLDTSLILDDGITWYFFNGNGGGETGVNLRGKVTFNGVTHLSIGDGDLTLTNVISGSGGFVWDSYNHLLVFTTANTYSGPTVIGSGLTLALKGNGSIAHSALIFFGGSDSTSNRVDVTGRPDQTLTLASGQTLAGVGGVNGSLVVSSGATVSPAGTNMLIGITSGQNTVGTIRASGSITLSGKTVIKLNGSGINDSLAAPTGNIAYGGTLNLTNVSGAPMSNGDTFQIASGASYSGSFASITPATPGAGLAWDTSQLNIGFINVIAAPPQPVVNKVLVSGGNLIFSGTNGTASGNYSVLTATNLTTPLVNWTALVTNSFDGTGAFSVTNAISGGAPQRFYLIKLVP